MTILFGCCHQTSLVAGQDVRIDHAGIITVTVVENPTVTIQTLSGNSQVKTDRLEEVVKLRRDAIFAEARAEADVTALRSIYRQEGRLYPITDTVSGSVNYSFVQNKIYDVGDAASAAIVAVLEAGSGDQLQAVSRVIQCIVTGIGFIGAGVIVQREQRHKVHGLTTAATVWVSAATRIVCGLGAWQVAATATALVAIVLIAGGPIELWLIERDHAPPSSPASEPRVPP